MAHEEHDLNYYSPLGVNIPTRRLIAEQANAAAQPAPELVVDLVKSAEKKPTVKNLCMCAGIRVCVCVRVRMRARAHVYLCVCVCVCATTPSI